MKSVILFAMSKGTSSGPRRLLAKALSLFGNREKNSGFETELADHLNLLTERYIGQGMKPEDARQAARRQFGNATLLQEDRREMQTIATIDAFARDLRYAGRMLRRNPAFAGAVVLTLALGIGANTAIFSVYDAVLLKPLPYGDPERVVMIWEKQRTGDPGTVAPANFVDWRAQASSFSEMAAMNVPNFILTGHGEPARLAGAAVSSNFFRLLRIRMKLGRDFLDEEDHPGNDRVAVLSYTAWQHRLGGNPDVLGRGVTLNDISYTVVGVLGPDFELVTNHSRNQPDVWVPLALNLKKLQRGTHPLRVFARIKPGVTFNQMQVDLNVVAANLANLYPEDNKGKGIVGVPLAQQVTQKVRTALTTLLAGVGLLLLIACANVANLLLSRAAARRKEMAVRLALGASRRRLGQQLLTESVLLSLLGGATGLLLASAAIRILGHRLPADLPRVSGLAVDVRVLAFTALITLATGILFGLAPLFQTRSGNANETLKQNARLVGGIQSRLRNGLVVAQIAIALVLLTGAALTAKSFWNLLQVSPGFRTEHVLTARVSLPASRYPDVRRISVFQTELLERVRNIPGIQSAGLTAYLPLSGADNGWAFFIEGRPPLPIGVYNMAKYRPVSPGYFETIGIPVLRGRGFTTADGERAPLVVVISDSMARAYWGKDNPVGQRLRFEKPVPRTIVGVVGDVHHEGLDGEVKPEMYVPFTQIPNTETRPTIVVRTAIDPAAITASLRNAVSGMDRALPLDQVETMEQLVSASVGQPRFRTILLAAFSMLALAIASVGIYGVMNYLVSQRIQEFGIRLAIGATEGDVLRLVLRRAAVLIAAGLAVGLLGSAMLARLITSLLYGVRALDPLTFLAVSLLLSAVALLASYIPARRATRVDPLAALRYE
jgi:putative ABC transport system permease protein